LFVIHGRKEKRKGRKAPVALARFGIVPGIVPQGKARGQLARDRTGLDRKRFEGHELESLFFADRKMNDDGKEKDC
jgi:hypothetical protein